MLKKILLESNIDPMNRHFIKPGENDVLSMQSSLTWGHDRACIEWEEHSSPLCYFET